MKTLLSCFYKLLCSLSILNILFREFLMLHYLKKKKEGATHDGNPFCIPCFNIVLAGTIADVLFIKKEYKCCMGSALENYGILCFAFIIQGFYVYF